MLMQGNDQRPLWNRTDHCRFWIDSRFRQFEPSVEDWQSPIMAGAALLSGPTISSIKIRRWTCPRLHHSDSKTIMTADSALRA